MEIYVWTERFCSISNSFEIGTIKRTGREISGPLLGPRLKKDIHGSVDVLLDEIDLGVYESGRTPPFTQTWNFNASLHLSEGIKTIHTRV